MSEKSNAPAEGEVPQKLTLEDIEAVFCKTATPEQHARYCAEINDPNSEINAMLTHIRTSESNVLNQTLPYPRRKRTSDKGKQK